MSHSLTNILVHTIFSTKNRQPFLQNSETRHELFNYMGGILTNLECQPVVIGGVEDHVHLLHLIRRTVEPANVVKELKRASSVWIKSKGLKTFAWQGGYGMFSIGYSQIPATRRYILGQEKHHRVVSFQDELRRILKRHEIAYHERYLWD